NLRAARETRQRFAWGSKYSDDIYRYFILPHQISQEPFVDWRDDFMEEIAPRVENLSMKEAILEVNHWCHEKATYKPTDGRDQDPLTTIRSGFGRCEEEMILTIAALRSVGIPARQCYTPYWAHCDDNHAWVEAWANGRWYYLGACEPAPSLDEAWFSNPAKRAMLVVSTAYGDYQGDEPVLRRFGRSTLINSTSVYGPTKELAVKVVNRKKKPVKEVKVIFSLWNYGALMPAASAMTDKKGIARLTCGLGDWFVSASKNDKMGFAQVKSNQTEVTLKLDADKPLAWLTECEYEPPVKPESKAPEVISAEGEARGVTSPEAKLLADSLFRCKLAWEDSVRSASLWPRQQLFHRSDSLPEVVMKPDSEAVWAQPMFASLSDTTRQEILDLCKKAQGNWLKIYNFLLNDIIFFTQAIFFFDDNSDDNIFNLNQTPYNLNEVGLPHFSQSWPPESYHAVRVNPYREGLSEFNPMRLALLKCLPEKDLRDITASRCTNITNTFNVDSDSLKNYYASLDSVAQERFIKYVVSPRIDYEPSREWTDWRTDLISFLRGEYRERKIKAKDESMLAWLRNNIVIEKNPDRLGPPMTPDQTLRLRRGTEGDRDRLYIGLCRARGIPARRNRVSGVVERWDEGIGWVTVEIERKPKGKEPKQGKLVVTIASDDSLAAKALYMKDWAVSKWEGNYGDVMDLGYHEPFAKIAWPQELPVGNYCLTNGIRREDGSAPVKFVWFKVEMDQTQEVELKFR
ncbi:MAG: transglutaminase domain-containing protein, partial [Calditrichota bacterium]